MIEAINSISHYLARRDIPTLQLSALTEPVDLLVLLGNGLLDSVRVTADAMQNGCARRLLISGGIGHSTPDLYSTVARHPHYCSVPTEGRPEADILYDILVKHHQIDPALIIVENQSTNCGANATESKRVLDTQNISPSHIILVQDPTMQRRTHASFIRAWRDSSPITLFSFAPFLPMVYPGETGEYAIGGSREGVWTLERFLSLIQGEIVRLKDDEQGYGPRGRNFIDSVEIPSDVLLAFEQLTSYEGKTSRRLPPP